MSRNWSPIRARCRFALLQLNKLQFTDIIATYDISETEGIYLLAPLDSMKPIELQPGNRIGLMLSNSFAWNPADPIQHFLNVRYNRSFWIPRSTSQESPEFSLRV